MNPSHNFVYVIYMGTGSPKIVGYGISLTGFTLRWEKEFPSGSFELNGSTIIAGPSYVIEYKYPAFPDELFLSVLDQDTGKELLSDVDPGVHGVWLISGRVDSTRTYYYSCRSKSSTPPATSVTVFAFKQGTDVQTSPATAIATSKDPDYVSSMCDEPSRLTVLQSTCHPDGF